MGAFETQLHKIQRAGHDAGMRGAKRESNPYGSIYKGVPPGRGGNLRWLRTCYWDTGWKASFYERLRNCGRVSWRTTGTTVITEEKQAT